MRERDKTWNIQDDEERGREGGRGGEGSMQGSIVIKLWGEKRRNPQRIQAESTWAEYTISNNAVGVSHNASKRISEMLLREDVQWILISS